MRWRGQGSGDDRLGAQKNTSVRPVNLAVSFGQARRCPPHRAELAAGDGSRRLVEQCAHPIEHRSAVENIPPELVRVVVEAGPTGRGATAPVALQDVSCLIQEAPDGRFLRANAPTVTGATWDPVIESDDRAPRIDIGRAKRRSTRMRRAAASRSTSASVRRNASRRHRPEPGGAAQISACTTSVSKKCARSTGCT